RLSVDRLGKVEEHAADRVCVLEQVHAHERRDLVVSAAARAKLAAELHTGNLDEAPLERRMHIFVTVGSDESAVCDPLGKFVERSAHVGELLLTQVAGSGERACVRL